MKKSAIAAYSFCELLNRGKIRKNILPNTSPDYTVSAEQSDLIRYKRFLNSSAYDEIKECEVRKYNADE
ncbi:MAG: hypothetical protein HFH91_01845 [Lachnospiraceae bacterium]|jgi:hypothetical protein|nr:hypothetical protein [Lachnospiraceae bacterium]